MQILTDSAHISQGQERKVKSGPIWDSDLTFETIWHFGDTTEAIPMYGSLQTEEMTDRGSGATCI